ncbi:HlyD family efflux transporter periplasmic adaptor subunit [Sphingomonas sp. ABOLD]|uniref:Membrane fusion protein (Multidrug efflux system) n=1 Tax=Sphingomonas trueperi TaxID=53317 RepID=A0A7X5Y1E9_9SPHN|nr:MULTISPECIES: HlyD family efflux transporter periplasmic adaptor subunit [Sphingomonas]NJB99311.1 membrane fusion protein (multidrug efflux system) [Sphingomonas trueperi]RSV40679.1 HlyD family efflux transporter periplasmic adaptor subunit [Sphingomonas sp. ABOLE]RSV48566.1 HlyD family efflux transporter periplasmic adaptor subunit [Sphingomonas sp. ABOLD]
MADAEPAIHSARGDAADRNEPSQAPAHTDMDDSERKNLRKRLMLGVGGLVLVAGLGYGGYYMAVGSHYVSTDNAYVGADSASITPMTGGQVLRVAVSDTQAVKKGDVLVQIDDSDARIALAQAEADLARATRQFGQTSATSEALAAQVQAREADIARARAQVTAAQADFEKARIDLSRRQKLAPNGAVSGEELTSATNAFQAARANLELAKAGLAQANSTRVAASGQLAANQALVNGATATTAPEVLAARAKVDQAKLDLARTVIRAPFDGVVTRRNVQVGQRVAPGAQLMLIVPLNQLYVDANFKEGQLTRVKVGQPVELTSDLYGGDVKYHGRVVGFSGGTGSSFALIPAQNATGNWIKVVQRLPVRVALDPKELQAHPLRVGLSMDAEIDTSAK